MYCLKHDSAYWITVFSEQNNMYDLVTAIEVAYIRAYVQFSSAPSTKQTKLSQKIYDVSINPCYVINLG